jgi:hypothetical protein
MSTDDAAPGAPFPAPTDAERTALALLDRQGWAAGAAVATAVSSRYGDAPDLITWTEPAQPGAATGDGSSDGDPLVISLGPARRGRRGAVARWRSSRLGVVLAGAAVVLVLAVAGALLATRSDDRSTVSSGGSAPAGSGETGTMTGDVVIASGEHQGEPWRLLLSDDLGDAMLEIWYRDGSASVGWGGGAPPPLIVSFSQAAGWDQSVVAGAAADGTDHVTVELPGVEPIVPRLYDSPEWTADGFVVFVPPDATGELVVTARDSEGNELGRESMIVG